MQLYHTWLSVKLMLVLASTVILSNDSGSHVTPWKSG
jgi:hypothetical protein